MAYDDLEDIEMEDEAMEARMMEVSPVVELSLNSVIGLTKPDMFKIKGTLEDREIVIMVDCRATHNFISLRILEILNLPMTHYGVIMGLEKAV